MKTEEPSLYVVVRHRLDPRQRFVNNWLDAERLEAITTTIEVGWFCQDAQQRGEPVYVHRSSWTGARPTVCCSATVVRVDSIDRQTSSVRFADQQVLDMIPPVEPQPGQGFYFAAPPKSKSLFHEILAALPTAVNLAEKVKGLELQRDEFEQERDDYQRCYRECQAAYKLLEALHAEGVRHHKVVEFRPGMRDHLLTFELDKTGDQLLVHADTAGLRYLASVLSRLAHHAEAGRREHAHLMTKDWSGRELSAVAQDSKCDLLHQVTIYGWTTKGGARDVLA